MLRLGEIPPVGFGPDPDLDTEEDIVCLVNGNDGVGWLTLLVCSVSKVDLREESLRGTVVAAC